MSKPIAGPLCTVYSIEDDLVGLGVQKGDTILLHSSLSALGWVSGGAEAVVLAFLSALGPEGTLVVPTFSGDNSDPAEWRNPPIPKEWHATVRDSIPAYNPLTTRVRSVGVVADTVRTWPGAQRSAHPQTSFTAIGQHSARIIEGHDVSCMLGEKSPLSRLEEVNAKILLLGVSFDKCTAFHLAEYRVKQSNDLLEDNSFAISTIKGRRWVTVKDLAVSDEFFNEIGTAFEEQGHVSNGHIGKAQAKLFELTPAVAYAEKWFRQRQSSQAQGVEKFNAA